MTIIVTMAGQGSRFREAGYTVPKYMIMARGKTLFEWSLESLVNYNPFTEKYIFVVRAEDDTSGFIRDRCGVYGINKVDVIEIDAPTDGQATTAMLAVKECGKDESILIYNIDTYVEADTLQYADIRGDGYIPCFIAEGDHWSFVKTDAAGRAIEIREKQRISDNCTIGAYYFKSAELYCAVYNDYYADGAVLERNEKYIAPLYNHMIAKGMEICISIVDKNKVHVLGTPEELNSFIAENS